jgi:hypothetical protein
MTDNHPQQANPPSRGEMASVGSEGEPLEVLQQSAQATSDPAAEPTEPAEPVQPPDDAPTGESDDPKSIELKANQLRSVEDLIRFAYQQPGKRLAVPASVLRSIAEEPAPDPLDNDPLFVFVADFISLDPWLAVPGRVLALLANAKPPIVLRRRLAAAMIVPLRRHPIFAGRSMRAMLDGGPQELDALLDGVRAVAKRITGAELGLGGDEIKPAAREKLISNTTVALVLLLTLRDGLAPEVAVDALFHKLWTHRHDPVDGLVSVGVIADSKDSEALAALGRMLNRQRRDAERKSADAEADASRARLERMEIEDELLERSSRISVLEETLAEAEAHAASLRDDLMTEQRSRVHDRSHHVDDFETLRTRVVRLLDRQTELLADGLHALRDGSTDVTEEFVERTLAALTRELEQLRRQGGPQR